MTRGDDETGLVLLDQWHVDILVPAAMDDAEAERVRSHMDASLRHWAVEANLGFSGVLVQVEQ